MRQTIAFFVLCRALIGNASAYAETISLTCSGTYTNHASDIVDAAFDERAIIDIENMTIAVPIFGTIPIKKKTDKEYKFTRVWSENGRVAGDLSGTLNRYTGDLFIMQEPAGKLFAIAGLVEGNCRMGKADADRTAHRRRRGVRPQIP